MNSDYYDSEELERDMAPAQNQVQRPENGWKAYANRAGELVVMTATDDGGQTVHVETRIPPGQAVALAVAILRAQGVVEERERSVAALRSLRLRTNHAAAIAASRAGTIDLVIDIARELSDDIEAGRL